MLSNSNIFRSVGLGALVLFFVVPVFAMSTTPASGPNWMSMEENFVSFNRDFKIDSLVADSEVELSLGVDDGVRRALFYRPSPWHETNFLYVEDGFCLDRVEFRPSQESEDETTFADGIKSFRMRFELPRNVIKQLQNTGSFRKRLKNLAYMVVDMRKVYESDVTAYLIEMYDGQDKLLNLHTTYESKPRFSFEWRAYEKFMCSKFH